MAHHQRLEGQHADTFLAGCFAVARDAVLVAPHFELAVLALEAAYNERPLLPAPTLALDLTALLSGERLLPIAQVTLEPLRDAMRAYEDHVLARLTADRRWTRLVEAVTATPKELRAAAIGMTVVQVFSRLGLSGGTGISQFIVRRFGTRTASDMLGLGRAALFAPAVVRRLIDGLLATAKAARGAQELLCDAEVFIVENIAALKGLGPRVALGQLAEVAQTIEEHLPARLRGHVFDEGEAPVALEDDSAYPVGGFSSISTVGNLENLVTSELMYMDERDAPRPDLFDIRFVESELLYYARDESVAIRRKRVLVLIFDSSLISARVLDGGEKYQRLVWLLGSVTALIRKLTSWLDTEALTFELIFTGSKAERPLAEEEAVIALLLREFRERGQVQVRFVDQSLTALKQVREAHGQRARAMVFLTKLPAGLAGDLQPEALIDVSGPAPVLHWVDAQSPRVETTKDTSEAWAQATKALLDGLLRRPRRGGVLRP